MPFSGVDLKLGRKVISQFCVLVGCYQYVCIAFPGQSSCGAIYFQGLSELLSLLYQSSKPYYNTRHVEFL